MIVVITGLDDESKASLLLSLYRSPIHVIRNDDIESKLGQVQYLTYLFLNFI